MTDKISATITPQSFLLEELYERQKRNPCYSRRAFARDMGVSPGFLSLLIRGDKALSQTRAVQIAQRLGWTRSRSRIFADVVRLEALAGTPEGRQLAGEIQRSLHENEIELFHLGLHHFQTISEWYHFAIVELTDLPEFEPKPQWIAKRLGISAVQAREALARLLTLGLLEVKDGKPKRSHQIYEVKGVPSVAIRKFHSQHLAKATRALKHQAVDKREITGTTLSISKEQIPLAKEMIREFLRKFNKAMEAGDKSHVYHLAMQFYALDQLGSGSPSADYRLPSGR